MKAPTPLRLLYVDDDRINTLLFVETCKPASHWSVHTSADSDDALAMAREATFDVLVIDLHLADSDGLTLLAALRAQGKYRDTPAFLCTAELIEEAREPALRAGFDGVWIKPVALNELLFDVQNARSCRAPQGPAAAGAEPMAISASGAAARARDDACGRSVQQAKRGHS